MTQRPIDLHIDRIVVDGLNPGDAQTFSADVARHLKDLLASDGLPAATPRTIGEVEAPPLARASGDRLAADTARAIHGGLKR